MRAAVCERYGPPEVVAIREVPAPEPGDGEVLIEVRATSVNSGDARIRGANFPRGMALPARLGLGITKPRKPILGLDVAGRVASVGKDVTRWAVGDRVVASRGYAFGCHAEQVVVAGDGAIATIPEGLGDQEAVAVCFGGMTARHFFERARLAEGETVLVNGASGAVGTMAIQLAKHAGAEVTAVCSAANGELVTSLGADHVVDYAAEDFTRDGRRYDLIMDNHGNAPYARIEDSLAPGGRFLMVVGDLWQTLGAARRKDVVSGTAKIDEASCRALMELAGEGELKPVIDTAFPFAQIVEAHRRVDTGHKVGSVVVTFDA
jgi:NADPH:quinone reductase-like Zn-dependent oxidoreductase